MRHAPILLPLCGLLFGAAASPQQQPGAAPRNKVVIVSLAGCCQDRAWPEVERKVEEELLLLDFAVEFSGAGAPAVDARGAALKDVATQSNAVCALRIVRSGRDGGAIAELWASNPNAPKPTAKKVEVDDKGASKDVSVFALRIIEALRASLLDVGVTHFAKAAPRVDGEAGGKKTAPETSKRQGPAVSAAVGVGGGAMGFANSTGLMGHVDVSLRGLLLPPFAFEANGTFSYPAAEFVDADERTSFGVALLRAWGLWEAGRLGPVEPSLGIGGGIVTAGGVRSGISPGAGRTTTAYLGAAVQAATHVWGALSLRAGFNAGAAIPEIDVNFTDKRAATFGRPLLDAFLRVEARVF